MGPAPQDGPRHVDATRVVQALLDCMPQGACLLASDGQCLHANAALARLLGHPQAAHLVGRPLSALLNSPAASAPTRLAEHVFHALRIASATRLPVDRCWRADGSSFPAQCHLRPLDVDGTRLGFLLIIEDVTSQQRDAESARLHKMLLAAQEEAASEGMLVSFDGETMAVFNRRRLEAWRAPEGTPAADAATRALQDAIARLRDPEQLQDTIEQLQAHRDELTRDVLYLKDGRSYDRYSAPLIGPDGTYDGRVWFFREMTDSVAPSELMATLLRAEEERELLLTAEKAAREEAEAANRTKDEFLATLSHELRTPLTSILGWARLLRMGKVDDASREAAIETIERNAKLQARLIEDILEISRVITGRVKLRLGPVRLRDVVQESVEVVRLAASAKRIALNVQCSQQDHPLQGDADRLQQVVWNLLSNAIKFTPEGGAVDVSLEYQGHHAVITVQDNGVGIPAEFLPHAFERFRQAEASSTRAYGGLGLGLAIARYLVELHGGTIHGASAGPNQGSTFTVTLPLSAEMQHPLPELPASSSAASRSGAPSLQGVRVLLVDDEADARDLSEFVLRNSGAEVRSVASAEEALAALPELAPHVLVSDLRMPGQDGFSLLRQVRALSDPQLAAVPAAAVTASALAGDRERALEAGFQVHLAKPVEPSDLTMTVARLAGRS